MCTFQRWGLHNVIPFCLVSHGLVGPITCKVPKTGTYKAMGDEMERNNSYVIYYTQICTNAVSTDFPPVLTLPLSTNSHKGRAVLNYEVEKVAADGLVFILVTAVVRVSLFEAHHFVKVGMYLGIVWQGWNAMEPQHEL
jgi:hypothetical protein